MEVAVSPDTLKSKSSMDISIWLIAFTVLIKFSMNSVNKMLCSTSQIFKVPGIKKKPSEWVNNEVNGKDRKMLVILFNPNTPMVNTMD